MDPRFQELSRNLEKPKKAACPFGCGPDAMTDTGYCRHLAGFTFDGDTFEVREDLNGFERVGRLIGVVADDDVLIENRSPSKRVYRRKGRFPIVDDGTFTERKFGPDYRHQFERTYAGEDSAGRLAETV